jgi:hypothetical protein
MFGLGLDQRSRIHREHMILDSLVKNQRKGVSVAVPRRWGPFPLIALLKQPCLNILSRNPFGWQVVEMLADDLKFDRKLRPRAALTFANGLSPFSLENECCPVIWR